jgi:hypothetical protein
VAYSDAMKAVLKGLGLSDAEIAAMEASSPSTTTSTSTSKTTKPTSTTYPSVYSKTQADSKITDIFLDLLDREPTTAELKTWRPRLIAAQKEFAAKQTYKRKGTTAEQASIGGLDEDFWLKGELSKDPAYKDEIKRLATLDPKIRAKEKAKKDYEAAVKAAGDNPTAIAALDQTTSYGIAITGLTARIKAAADQAGASLDEGTILQIAQEAFDTNQDQDPVKFNTFVNSKLQIGPVSGQYKGEAADNYQKLFELGIDNGINIETDPRFKGQVDSWLTQVTAGTPLANFEGIIRAAAAEGQPAFVQSLLKAGQDLRSIYGNYISRMAKFFNVDESTIDLNDPLLKKVFTDKGGMSFKQFESTLLKDPRVSGAEKGDKLNNRQYIIDRALQLGVELTDADVDSILDVAFSLDLSTNAPEIDKLIRGKFNYAPGKAFGGQAGQTVIDLRQTAAANGIDLDTQFGGQLDSWIERVMQGETVDTFKNLIRRTAKIGLPENVGKLLDEGVDLETVYNPYKNLMAKVLEINPETIRLDDPVLRSAITSQGETSLYDYQRMLRQDPRWQYTNNAREDVSNVALQVLRDFGFQG